MRIAPVRNPKTIEAGCTCSPGLAGFVGAHMCLDCKVSIGVLVRQLLAIEYRTISRQIAKLLMMVIRLHANHRTLAGAFPSHASLMRATSTKDPRVVRRELNGLVEPGALIRNERPGQTSVFAVSKEHLGRWVEERMATVRAVQEWTPPLRLTHRRSDVVPLGRQHVRDGWLRFTQQKNRSRKPITLQLPVLPALQAIIDASPVGDMTFLLTAQGRPFTANGFGGWFRERCNEAGHPQCSAHGLRKAGAVIAAANGATAHQLMSVFGWLTLKQSR